MRVFFFKKNKNTVFPPIYIPLSDFYTINMQIPGSIEHYNSENHNSRIHLYHPKGIDSVMCYVVCKYKKYVFIGMF